MAAVTVGTLEVVWAPAEFNKLGKASAALNRGDPVIIDGAAAADPRYDSSYKKATAETFVHGIVLKNAISGGPVEVGTLCELEGYSGLTPGAAFTVAAGKIDDTAPAAGERGQFLAISATRIEFRR